VKSEERCLRAGPAIFTEGEPLDLSGLVVTANYNDGSSAMTISYTSNPANSTQLSTTGSITVTISYAEGGVTKTDTFPIIITPDSSGNGDLLTGTPGFVYELIGGGTAYRVKKGTVTGGAVVIPASYNGLPKLSTYTSIYGNIFVSIPLLSPKTQYLLSPTRVLADDTDSATYTGRIQGRSALYQWKGRAFV